MPRKTDYKPEYDQLAFNYSLLGATDVQMAKYFGVCDKTIDNWKRDHPSFLRSIKEAKEEADSQVVKSLYDRARGITVTEERVSSGGEEQVITRTTKHQSD